MAKREHNKESFGGLLYKLRRERAISFDDFRARLGVSKSYLNDVETDACRPPTPKVQIAMIKILSGKKALTKAEIAEFYTRAALLRGEIPADIALFLSVDEQALDSIRADPNYISYWQKNGMF